MSSTKSKRRTTQGRSSSLVALIYLCVLLSGAAGLIYEVVWSRQLGLFLGITAYAHTVVITAYMIGLALGSVVMGWAVDRRGNPLRLYAWLEIGIGIYAVLTPWLFTWMQSAYALMAQSVGLEGAPAHMARFVLALFGLLIPTFMMGGTLPALVRGLTQRMPDVAVATGRLYGINTLGATAGAFLAGYLLLPALGIRATTFTGVVINVSVGVVILYLLRNKQAAMAGVRATKGGAQSQQQDMDRDSAVAVLPNMTARLLLVGFAISGFAALIYQIAWIRALTLIIGGSVYAFSATLTTFLAGIGIGSLLYSRYLAGDDAVGAGKQMGQAAVMEMILGLTALIGLPLLGQLPKLFLAGYSAGLAENFVVYQMFIFALCFLLMFIPTLLLGALFPLITGLWTRDADAVGRGVGTAYAANTVGTVVGALFGGLVLLPTLGVQNSIIMASTLHVPLGPAFGCCARSTKRGGGESAARRLARWR